jgi:hypothetical protein
MAFATASFTGTALTELSAADSNWTKHTSYSQNIIIGGTGEYVVNNAVANALYWHESTPPSADYSVSADIAKLSGTGTSLVMAVCGRINSASDEFYFVQYTHSALNIRMYKRAAGNTTQLGTAYTITLTSTPVNLKLVLNGDQISAELDGTTIIGPVTDTAITAAGYAGIRLNDTRTSGVDGGSLDNFSADTLGAISTQAPRSMHHFNMLRRG